MKDSQPYGDADFGFASTNALHVDVSHYSTDPPVRFKFTYLELIVSVINDHSFIRFIARICIAPLWWVTQREQGVIEPSRGSRCVGTLAGLSHTQFLSVSD